jgi:hypothetical protein
MMWSRTTVLVFALLACNCGKEPQNTKDGDTDCDPLGSIAEEDFDGDGIANSEDSDDDNDTIPDTTEHVVEECELVDHDWDGNPDGFDSDADGDYVCDNKEAAIGTNPYYFDTDDDGIPDWMEIRFGTNPTGIDDFPFEGVDEIVTLAMSGWDFDSCCSERPATRFIDLVADSSAAHATLLLTDVLPTFRGMGSLDFISSVSISEIIPADGGTIDSASTITDLQAGSTVRVELTSGWSTEHDIVICENAYLLNVSLVNGSEEPVSSVAGVLVWVQFSFELGQSIPTHTCALFPDCPPQEW